MSESAALSGIRVLVVEDSMDNQILVSRYLKKEGAQVEVASNGQESVEKAMASDYDVILMDIQMPVLDGNQATIQLRKKGFRKPIIAVTAHALQEERERALKGGFDDYLTKPLDRRVLIDDIRKLCSR